MTLTSKDYDRVHYWAKPFKDESNVFIGVVIMRGQQELALLTCNDAKDLGLNLIECGVKSVEQRNHRREIKVVEEGIVQRLVMNWNS